MFKHIFESYVLLSAVVMVVLHIVDNTLRRLPGLGTTDLILTGVGIYQIFNYMSYQMKMGRIVVKYWRINRHIRFPEGFVQCYDAYGSEYRDNITLAIEDQYGLVYRPIELKITADKVQTMIKLPYMAELPRTMSASSIKAEIEELSGVSIDNLRIFDLIFDRYGYHKIIGGDDESEQPVVSYREIIVYCTDDIMNILKIGPNQAFGAGWAYTHSSVGDLNLDFKGMLRGDVALCQVQEGDDEEIDLTPNQQAKIMMNCMVFLNDRVIKRSQVLERWFEQENNGETDQKAQDDARRAVEEDTYMARHPDEAEDDIDRYKAEELRAKKKEHGRGWGWVVVIVAFLITIAITFK